MSLYLGWVFSNVLVPLLVLGVLIFVHELGHFLVAKWCGVGVLKFSIGFGPRLFGWRRRETEYQVSLIPLGGFVRMVGDMPDSLSGAQVTDAAVREGEGVQLAGIEADIQAVVADKSRWFIEKPLAQRGAIVIAGPLFNYVFAIVLVFLSVFLYGEEIVEEGPVVGGVMAGSPAEIAGLKRTDKVLSYNGEELTSWERLAERIHTGDGNPVKLLIESAGVKKELTVYPQKKEVRGFDGKMHSLYLIGIERMITRSEASFGKAAQIGWSWAWHASLKTYEGLWGMLSGEISPKDLAGPLFILDTAGKQAEKGFEGILSFMASLSISLAVLNMLPIPVLDGGHLFFFLIEALIGPISIRKKEFAQQIGVLLLLSLMVFAVHNDIFRDKTGGPGEVNWEPASSK